MMLWKKIPKRTVISPVRLKEILSLILNKSENINNGNFVERFEDSFREYTGSREAIAVSSGRFAMHLILRKLGLEKDDGVILSAYNFSGVPKAILDDGLCPILVDANKDTYQIDIDKIESRINKNTKAIIATHLFGQPCELNKIIEIARKYNLFVIEDAAHSIGSFYHGRHTGTMADAGFFSFTGSKTLNTSFGGMIITNNTDLADKIRKELLNYPFPERKELIKEIIKTYLYSWFTNRIFFTIFGYPISLLLSGFNLDPLEIYKASKHKEIAERKMKFTEYQASVGVRNMIYIDKLISQRKKITDILLKNLHPSISIQKIPPDCQPNYFMIPLKAKNKIEFCRYLLFKGIDPNIEYASDCSYIVKGGGPAHTARFISEHVFTLNLPYSLEEKEVISVAEVLNKAKDRLY